MITPSYSLTATERVLPRLALDFTTASLDSRVTFTRTTSASNPATYVASTGFIISATNDQPRFDYDPVSLVCKGLLIEESRVNNLTYSEDFRDTATAGATRPFQYSAVTVSADVLTAPNNTATASKLVETNTTASHFLYRNYSFTSGSVYTITIFAKAGERDFLRILFPSSAFGSNLYAYFDLTNGTLGTKTSNITSAISAYKDGWYRLAVTATATATATGNFTFLLALADNGGSYAGDGTSGLYIWGAQLEAGAFATSYIPTTTTALTRNADVAVMTGTNFSDWFNASEGAVFVEASVNFTPLGAGGPELYSINSGSSANIFAPFFANATGYLNTNVRSGSSAQATLASTSAATVGTIFRHCAAYKVDSFASSFNAATPATDSAGAVPVGPNVLVLGDSSYNGVGNKSRYFRKFFYYPQRLTNAELQSFSK